MYKIRRKFNNQFQPYNNISMNGATKRLIVDLIYRKNRIPFQRGFSFTNYRRSLCSMSYNGLIELVKLVDIITVIIVLTAGHVAPPEVLLDITNIGYFQFGQVRLGALTLTIRSPR